MELISVIMPCYNAASYLEEAVMSVVNQTYTNVELIVVDDGSTDQSSEILQQLILNHPNRIKYLRQNREGPYVARNRGLDEADGACIAFLDADDWWCENFIEKLHNALANNADVTLAYCGWQNIHEGGTNREPYVPPPYEEHDLIAAFLKGCPWPIHATLVRRSLIDSVGGFSERMYTSMDYDLWLRLSALSPNIIRVPEVLAYYRWHDKGQISGVKWRQVLNSHKVKLDFIKANTSLVSHLTRRTLRELTGGQALKHAYIAYWKRDLVSARRIFRLVLRTGAWKSKDLRYLLPALLPEKLYLALIGLADRSKTQQV